MRHWLKSPHALKRIASAAGGAMKDFNNLREGTVLHNETDGDMRVQYTSVFSERNTADGKNDITARLGISGSATDTANNTLTIPNVSI